MDSSVSLSVSGIQLYSNMNLIQMAYFQVSRPFPSSSYTKIQIKKVKQNYNGDIKVGDDIAHYKNFLFLFSTNNSVGIMQHRWRVDMQRDTSAHDFPCLKKNAFWYCCRLSHKQTPLEWLMYLLKPLPSA